MIDGYVKADGWAWMTQKVFVYDVLYNSFTSSRVSCNSGSSCAGKGVAADEEDLADEGTSSKRKNLLSVINYHQKLNSLLLMEIMKSRNPTSIVSGSSSKRSLLLYTCGYWR